ncbi:cbb3-type cytochrome oxidase assembly protein CcoS [Hymenobacter endophyticus]|uniref:Cbb3-type cytochrome oxidase assembly protein CcoS n=1 Tax=Hymenobacter endophyticus TaxID=3076335 RepID=A0ABU3TKZ2_9BACT|nr:cbb3-type cytochrome oxidase assembly protein CcoS [Hymenobacter endophyticus]MDU0372043.1 cbb3-type cytochrome oxidase assembly protein CcoS [Hymenobacter endophyticus]
MTIIFPLIGISLLVALLFLGGFLWAVRSGQYDDAYTPSVRMLFDDVPDEPADPDEPRSGEKPLG